MSVLFSDDELHELTGYHQPAAQLRELLRQGFWRARRLPITGRVALERAHYEAVCASRDALPAAQGRRSAPRLMSETR